MLWKPTNRLDSVTVNQTWWIVLFDWWAYMPLAAGQWHMQDSNKYFHWQFCSQCSVTLKKYRKLHAKNAVQLTERHFAFLQLFPHPSFLLIRCEDVWRKKYSKLSTRYFLLLSLCASSDLLQLMHTCIVTLVCYLQLFFFSSLLCSQALLYFHLSLSHSLLKQGLS